MNAGKLFVKTIFILIALVLLIGQAQSQTDPPVDPCPPMPPGMICLPRAVAVKALEDADVRKALEAQVKAQDAAIAGYKDELEKMRIEFARASGENTALKQNAVSDRAIIQILVQYARPKKIGLNLF